MKKPAIAIGIIPKGGPDEAMDDYDGSEAEDHGETGESSGENELCVTLKSVAVPDEGENAVAPEEGDEVNVDIKATVTRVEGDMVYLKATEANGEPIPGSGDDDEHEPDADDSMRSEMSGPAGQQKMY